MKLLLAQMKHETNTFSPVVTDLARFSRGQATPYYDIEAYDAFVGTGSALGAFIAAAEAVGAEIDIPIARQRLAQRAGRRRRVRAHLRAHCGAGA